MLHSDALQSASFDSPGNPWGPDQRDSIDFDAILRFFRKRRRLCAIWLLGGVIAGIAYAIMSPPYYTASASVLLEDRSARTTGAPAAETDGAHSTYVETQVQVFESDEVIGRVVDEKGLTQDPEFGRPSNGLRALLIHYVRPFVRSTPAPVREPRYATIIRVRHGLSVHRVGTSDVLEIDFTSRDANRSADFVNAIIQSYVNSGAALQAAARAETESHVRKLLIELRDKAFPVPSSDTDAAVASETGPETRARFLEQQDRTDTYRALYGRLLQRALGAADRESLAANIRVITPAAPPLLASSSLVIVAAFTVIGGVFGFVHALFREATDDTLRNMEDVQRLDGADRVAVIPKLNAVELQAEGEVHGPLQTAYTAAAAPVYDAMARLAVTLRDGGNWHSGWVVSIASPTQGAGVSVAAAQLARVIAESGQKTILLDANWRQAAHGQALLSASQGRKLARGLGSVQRETNSLVVLMLRATTPLSDLNASLSVVSAIEVLRAEHDYVLVDLHACDQTADLEAVMSVTDQVIMVAESGRTTSRSLRSCLRKIPRHKLAAVVLNKA